MSDLNSKEFTIAAKIVKQLPTTPNNNELLELYSYYKQATIGDINIDRPGFLNIKDRQKWDSWNERKGLSKQDAETKYINLVLQLTTKYPKH
jgi:diazepam-binding inhibitor (GABA receptor modulating acyl-CoA-binding protein)